LENGMTAGPSDPSPAAPDHPAKRRRPPAWGVALFLVLLAGLLALNSWLATGGPTIQWIDNNLDHALKQAAASHQRVFLYLYDPKDPVHTRNEQQVFSQRWARDPLKNVVSCRVVVQPDDAIARRYGYTGKPLFLLLNSQGTPLTRTEGAVDQLQFETYIGRPSELAIHTP
jgi:hypothetical protein